MRPKHILLYRPKRPHMRRPQADGPLASSSSRFKTLPGRASFRGSPTSPGYADKIIRIVQLDTIRKNSTYASQIEEPVSANLLKNRSS
ncbi:jg22641 [Pararge aegeria aegeria]|uniref:Jg22641 protein n=1 Tax=Pararge aegeria aegeria TaxID=348720 RepID=A0A8S4R961_9NEOP|nr:jg22641 [Pararge aegeria aegeria]